MVQHKALFWKMLNEFRGDRQVPRIYKHVIGQAELLQRADAPKELGSQQKTVVRLALHDMANPEQSLISGKLCQLRPNIRRAKINPSDHTDDGRLALGDLKKPAGLL